MLAPIYMVLWVTSFTPDWQITSRQIVLPFEDMETCQKVLGGARQQLPIGKRSDVAWCEAINGDVPGLEKWPVIDHR